MEPGDAELVVNSIDIRLVKEQLRLLGHTVDDAVILSFVEGLGTGAAASNANEGPAGKYIRQVCFEQSMEGT